MIDLGYGIKVTEEQYNYEFCGFWTDDRQYFDNEEEAIEFYNKMSTNINYEDIVMYKGKTIYFNFAKMIKWKGDSWVVGWKKVPLMRRLRNAIFV